MPYILKITLDSLKKKSIINKKGNIIFLIYFKDI